MGGIDIRSRIIMEGKYSFTKNEDGTVNVLVGCKFKPEEAKILLEGFIRNKEQIDKRNEHYRNEIIRINENKETFSEEVIKNLKEIVVKSDTDLEELTERAEELSKVIEEDEVIDVKSDINE